jgi:peptide/nickel transport system ATP-binding protein/oligopeptide transport system ATP-binding protein
VTETSTKHIVGAPPSDDILLEVRNLRTYFRVMDGTVPAVDGIDFSLGRGRTLGIVGESGSGKSVTLRGIMRLLRHNATASGRVSWKGRDIMAMPEARLRDIRGSEMAMIFQEPMTALNPVLSIR